MTLRNWMPGKGNPYSYNTFGQRELPKLPEIKLRILSEKERKKYETKPEKKTKKSKEISIGLNGHIKTIEKLPVKFYQLLKGNHPKDGLITYVDDVKGATLNPDIKHFKAYLDYPFSETVEVSIPAKFDTYGKKSKNGRRPKITENALGYYLIQISKAYGFIYKKMHKEVGLYGHGFDDLYFEQIFFTPNNQIELFIGS